VKKPEDAYATECAEAAKNRQDLREAVVAVRAAIIETAKAFGVDSAKRLRDLTHTMQVLTGLQAEADAHFAAWRASKKTTTRALELEVPILELPRAGDVDARLDNLDETLLGPCWKPFRELGCSWPWTTARPCLTTVRLPERLRWVSTTDPHEWYGCRFTSRPARTAHGWSIGAGRRNTTPPAPLSSCPASRVPGANELSAPSLTAGQRYRKSPPVARAQPRQSARR
jgi:hypothetical protein